MGGACTNPKAQGCPAMPVYLTASIKYMDMTRNSSETVDESAGPFAVSQPDDVSDV